MTPTPTTTSDPRGPEAERANHRYIGNEVPWYVHGLWVLFWAFAMAYVLTYLVPAIRSELLAPP